MKITLSIEIKRSPRRKRKPPQNTVPEAAIKQQIQIITKK